MAWLTYEVVAFYMNIMAMGVFLLLSSCKRFISMKERLGLAPELRKKEDFLTYCKDDIYWFQLWFTQLMLCFLALIMRTNDYEGLHWVIGNLFTRHTLEAVFLRQMYFNSKFQIKTYINLILFAVVMINCYMVKLFLNLEK